MDRMLIVGKLNVHNKELNEFFGQYFESHLCSEEIVGFDKVLGVTGPMVVVISMIGNAGEMDPGIFRSVARVCPGVPTITIGNDLERKNYMYFYGNKQFSHIDKDVDKEEMVRIIKERVEEYRAVKKREEIKEADADDIDIEAELAGLSDMLGGVEPLEEPQVEEDPHDDIRVLVIDDDPMMLRSLKAILDGEYDVSLATSGMKGITAMAKKRPDVILLDYEMPVCDGKQTLEMIRSDEDTKDIPVIFLTGLGDMEHIKSVLALKPAAYILKPANKDSLMGKIDEALKK